MMEILATKKMR